MKRYNYRWSRRSTNKR